MDAGRVFSYLVVAGAMGLLAAVLYYGRKGK